MSSTKISESTHTLHIQRTALPLHCISESMAHCYSETWRSEDMYLAKNTSASCLSSLSENHHKLFSSSSSWHCRLGCLRASHGGVISTAWCSSHGSMCADVPTEVPLQQQCDHRTMAAAEAESHGGASLHPSDGAVVLGPRKGRELRGSSTGAACAGEPPCQPPSPASRAAALADMKGETKARTGR